MVPRKQPHAGCFYRSNHQPLRTRALLAQLPQRCCARFLNFGVRGQVLERQHIVRRQPQDLRWVERARQLTRREHSRVHRLCGFIVGNDEQQAGRVGSSHKQRQV